MSYPYPKTLYQAPLYLLLLAALLWAGCEQASVPTAALEDAPEAQRIAGPTAASKAVGGAIPGQYIVVFEESVGNAPELARSLAAAHRGELLFTYEHALQGFALKASAQAAAALERNPNVAYVEADQKVFAVGTQSNATWGLDRIDQRASLDGSYTYNTTGAGVHAYIIDTGIRTSHNDFGGRAVSGYDFIDGDADADDCNGHGTHVAGTVGGTEYGVAKGVSLVAVRVLDCEGSGTMSGVIAGVDWVTQNARQPAVANMSLGGGASSSLDTAVKNAIAAGVTFAVAAGNGDFIGREQDACNVSPARVPEAMTIGATDNSDTKASWSNYGSCVDWFAPGVSITSAWIDSDSDINTISGTSMATPHVAGVAALYLETNTGASPQQVRDALYNATTKGIVQDSRTADNHLLYSLVSGGSGGGTTNNPPTASFTYTCTDLACGFDGSGSSDPDGDALSYSWTFGDGATATGVTTSHTYANGGTYTVTLTVSDGSASDSDAQSVTVSSSEGGGVSISLTASGYKVRGRHHVDLTWSGATSTNIDVYRNGSVVTTTGNDGAYTDATNNRGGASYTYKVCEAGTSTCSNEAAVTF